MRVPELYAAQPSGIFGELVQEAALSSSLSVFDACVHSSTLASDMKSKPVGHLPFLEMW